MIEFKPKELLGCIKRSSVYMEEQGYKISAIILRNRKGVTNQHLDHDVEAAFSRYEIDRINDIPLVESVLIYFKRK